MHEKSSDAVDGMGLVITCSAPTSLAATWAAKAASRSVLTVGGNRREYSSSARAPWAAAVCSAISAMRRSIRSCTDLEKVRTVPPISTKSGITLRASMSPPRMAQMLSTAFSMGGTLRGTMWCSAEITWLAATTGSAARCGWAPWPPLPMMRRVNMSADDRQAPGATATVPTGSTGELCSA
ncbi:hypothetical protein D3C72_1755960 [compost metagenome]